MSLPIQNYQLNIAISGFILQSIENGAVEPLITAGLMPETIEKLRRITSQQLSTLCSAGTPIFSVLISDIAIIRALASVDRGNHLADLQIAFLAAGATNDDMKRFFKARRDEIKALRQWLSSDDRIANCRPDGVATQSIAAAFDKHSSIANDKERLLATYETLAQDHGLHFRLTHIIAALDELGRIKK